MTHAPHDEQQAADARALERLGYAQELLREMGGFANFALSFSIISILTGAVTLYAHGLRYGGPFEMTVGWPLVTLLTLPVAASLAELASAYPTAGALYHWAALLGGRGWGFLTAWMNTIGQFAITAGIDYGLAELIAPLLGLPADRAHVLPLYAVLLGSHALANHVGVRLVTVLNWFSAWYHIAGVGLLVGALVLFGPRADLGLLLTQKTVSEHGYLYGFLVGLLQAGWTFTGYDASAHVTEETLDPSRNAPWGIVLSVVVSGVVGWLMLLCVTAAIGDLNAVLAAENPFLAVLTTALGARFGTLLVWVVAGAMWFCGLASVTSNSRMLFAFARDGGLPGAAWVARVSPRWKSPHVAVWISVGAAFAVGLLADVYSVMTALSTIALYASYGIPIACSLWARRAGGHARRGPWNLGRFSTAMNLIAVAWIAVLTVLFVLPPNELAGTTFAGALVVLAIYWFGWMRKRFAGPRLDGLR
jgi:amino acid transporter